MTNNRHPIFEGVDEIEWSKLDARGGDGIPKHLQDLLSDNKMTRLFARFFLFGEGETRGDIYAATAFIIPFCTKLLGTADLPDKDEILSNFKDILGKTLEHLNKNTPLNQLQRYVRVYDAIEAGIPIYLNLLNDSEKEVRYRSAALLGYLDTQPKILVKGLLARLQIESENQVIIALIKSVTNLLLKMDYQHLEELSQHFQVLLDIVESHPYHEVKVAAAEGMARISGIWWGHYDPFPSSALDILVEEFWRLNKPSQQQRRLEIMEALTSLRYHPLDLLSRPDITPEDAHMAVRVYLVSQWGRFDSFGQDHWVFFPREFQDNRPGIYYSAQTIYRGSFFSDRGLELWSKIVDLDAFWEIPTNMLTVFYGLPSTREELRKFLENPSDLM